MTKEIRGDRRADRLKSALRANLKKRKTAGRKLIEDDNPADYKLRESRPGKRETDKS